METFEIPIGPEQRQLRIEPQQGGQNYKLFAADPYENWDNNEEDSSVELPPDGLMGTLTIRGEKDFTFDGTGPFSGDELLGIVAQIMRHPSYGQQV